MLKQCIKTGLAAILLAVHTASPADENTLPDPLTLDYVLNYDIMSHPVVQLINADIQTQQANQIAIDSRYDITAEINARLQYIEPPDIAVDQSSDDHKLSLFVRKRLYDFGRTRTADSAINASIESERKLQNVVLNEHRIAIMADFFNVLLADLQYLRDNEAMASAYIKLDRARARKELGQMSDIEVLELDNRYQQKRRQYFSSRNLQRIARARLANSLGIPGAVINNLNIPAITISLDNLPDATVLQQFAMDNNPQLLALKAKLEASRLFLEESRLSDRPTLDSEIELSDYTHEASGNDAWRANITLSIPLTSNSKDKALISKKHAELVAARSSLQLTRANVLQDVLETRMLLETLRIEREQKRIQEQYRDYYLDKNRALYEMEVQAELGDSMIELTSAQLETARTEYNIALAWARLQTLLGLQINLTSGSLLSPVEMGHD